MRMASSCELTEIRFIQWLDVRRCLKDSEFIALLSLGLVLSLATYGYGRAYG